MTGRNDGTGWNDGYITDVDYTRNAYREMTPAWLATTALLLGQRPPDLSQPFRYADLGCGHGLTATIVAATCPHAEVWGFDFNPVHVESGRQLASAAGLTNLHFQEASFADLAALPADGLPEFDFIVSHGVASWISPENFAHLTRIIGQRLRSGGLAYLSYNVTTGWAAVLPARTLMRTLMRSGHQRPDQAAAAIFNYLDILKDSGALFFAANPMVEKRLTETRKQDQRYLAHEFLNADWHPLMFAEMAEAMKAVKCTYIGSATLPENVDAISVPPGMMKLVTEATDPILRETLRDFGLAQTFRRDVYRRGTLPLMALEHLRLFDEVELVWTGRVPDDPIVLGSPLGQVTGMPEIYAPLMKMVMAEDHTVGALHRSDAFANRQAIDLSQAVSLLIASGYLHPALPVAVRTNARAGTDRLNAAICAFNADGGDIPRLAAATIGSEVGVDLLETLVVREALGGRSMEIDGLTDRVRAALTQAGRSVQRDGKPVGDMNQARMLVRGSVATILERRLPLLSRLGVIAT
jgi:SAM-dependent methyltransferase